MSQTPERRLPLEGASNFRDLGGYETEDGRTVRWRKVFRSGALDRLSDADLETLAEIGLRTICDLRHAEEQEKQPTRLHRDAPATIHSLPIRPRIHEDRERMYAGGAEAQRLATEFMTEAYRCYVRDHADAYKGLMHRLADPANHPLVFHCAAGKDRTGFAAALILMTLGVPEETIYEDYLATNDYWTESVLRIREEIPAGVREQLRIANDAYLRAAIETLHEVHDGLDAYLQGPLAMNADDVARLRALLLEG